MMNPRENPNAFGGFSTAAIAAFLVAEADRRFGLKITLEEAGFIVGSFAGIYLLIGKRRAAK